MQLHAGLPEAYHRMPGQRRHRQTVSGQPEFNQAPARLCGGAQWASCTDSAGHVEWLEASLQAQHETLLAIKDCTHCLSVGIGWCV